MNTEDEERFLSTEYTRYFGFLMSIDQKVTQLNSFVKTLSVIINKMKNENSEVVKAIDEFCEHNSCVDLILQYKLDLELDRETKRLVMGKSSLTLYKKFRYSFRSKKRAKKFINSMKMHNYLTSQTERNPDLDKLSVEVGQYAIDYCAKISKKYGISKSLFPN